jgi:type I restriction enzyme S subunit
MQLLAESRSGKFPQITFDILCSLKIALPRDNELVNYYTDNYLVPFYKKMIHVEKENQKTTKLRDTLLPKLISGEVRVKDIEQTLKTI